MKSALFLVAAFLLGAAAGCVSGPEAGEAGARRVHIRTFTDDRVAAGARHLDLGVTAAAVLAEQVAATEGFALVLPEKELDKTRLGWERRAENPSQEIPVTAGEAALSVQGEISTEGEDLVARASVSGGSSPAQAAVRAPLGAPGRIKLLFRELALRLLVDLEPDRARLWVRLGITLREEGLVREAVDSYRKAAALDPSFAAAHYNLGVALDVLGDLRGAAAAYKRAVEADAAHLEARYNWALDDLRAREEGEEEKAFQLRVTGAVELLRQVIALDPREKEAGFLLVHALELKKEYSLALDECARLRGLFPEDSRVHEVGGGLLLRLKRFEEAWQEFHKAAEVEPALITNVYFLALALEGMGRESEAAAHYASFIERAGEDPKFSEARQDARRRLLALRDGGEAGGHGG